NVPSPLPGMNRKGMSLAALTSATMSSLPSLLKSPTTRGPPATPDDFGVANVPSPLPRATTIVDDAPTGKLDETRSTLPSRLKSPTSDRAASDNRLTDTDGVGRLVCAVSL